MLIRKIPVYNMETKNERALKEIKSLDEKFYISLPAFTELTQEKVLISIPDVLELRVIKRSYGDDTEDIKRLYSEHIFFYNEENEWILELCCNMHTDDSDETQKYYMYLPFSAPFMKDAEIGIYFDGVWLRFMKNGEVLNQNKGRECFAEPCSEIYIDPSLEQTTYAEITNVNITYREEKSDTPVDFFYPYMWNTNIGDVMNFYHNGTYHAIYLLDRRHHGSGDMGEHYIVQLTTNDLVDWYEQKPIVELDKPWMSCGTGTMLYHNGKYYMSYGLHTERYSGKAPKLTSAFSEEKGEFTPISFEEIYKQGGLPAGASYSVSDDGINFEMSEMLFHSARNPSAYSNNGKITAYCGYGGEGVWESEDFCQPFSKANNNFSFAWGGQTMKNTSECPSLFEWNGYKYLIVGFSGYYRTISPDSNEFVDAYELGESIYDSLSVPMVAEFKNNRRIIAGWVRSPLGWGGPMVQRELLQEENGKLGMRWIPELSPNTNDQNLLCEKDVLKGTPIPVQQSFLLELTVNPSDDEKFAVQFIDGQEVCELQLDFKMQQAQFNNSEKGVFAEKIPTMLEEMKKADKSINVYSKVPFKDIPQNAVNFTLPDIQGMDKEFCLRVICRYSRRMRATVIDAEIAGRRTILSVRKNFFPDYINAITSGNAAILKQSIKIINTESL